MTLSVAQLAARQMRLWEALKEEHRGTPAAPRVRPTVSLSRQVGVDVSPLAERVAQRFHYSIWDHQIIDYVARSVGVRGQLIESLERQSRNNVEQWVEGTLRGKLVDASDYARALVQVLRALGEQGGVVVVGRGANFVLPPESTVRVRVVAPLEWRALQVRETDESEEEARRRVREQDARRVEFVRTTLKADPEDPSAYDLVLNAARLAIESQERLIWEALHGRG